MSYNFPSHSDVPFSMSCFLCTNKSSVVIREERNEESSRGCVLDIISLSFFVIIS